MIKSFSIFFCVSAFAFNAYSQAPDGPARPIPSVVPIKPGTSTDDRRSALEGRTYRNSDLGFEIVFPDSWHIPGDDFDEYTRSQGIDLGLKPPETVDRASRIQIERALERVSILVTAYRSTPGSHDNAILRIAVEELHLVPAVKDAVDYFDLMRSQFTRMKLPADFKYSETQAERLGRKQFAFLDTSSDAGKKRMYATVIKGLAVIFTLTYTRDEDLQEMRKILVNSNFELK